jgi:hypothetical protein
MSKFPGNKRFAFTVFDDTDFSTVENVGPVYRFLSELGMRTTKSVWVLPKMPGAEIGGGTLYDRDYLRWVQKLDGFEIALHNVRSGDAPRDLAERGFREFEDLLGFRPRTHANHLSNRENIYWGAARFSYRLPRTIYNLANRLRHMDWYQGHVPGSEYFWGDICKERIDYVRNFVVPEINLDRVNPSMPYHASAHPFVNFWFSSCEGGSVESFCETLSEANQDRLEAEGGVCIMYTHFGSSFWSDGKLHPKFERLMRRLAKKDGWFVPVSTLLDHLRLTRNHNGTIPPEELAQLERGWLAHKIYVGPDRSGRSLMSSAEATRSGLQAG